MKNNLEAAVREICRACGRDRTRMMDIVRAVQARFRCVSGAAMELIAREVGTHRVEVESVVSFYAFLSNRPKGQVIIRLCNDVVDEMAGVERIAWALEQELGIPMGGTTADGNFSLEWTPCIGLCDQAPAALINDVPVTELNTDEVRRMVRELREHLDPNVLVRRLGDGNNAHDLVHSMVRNNLRMAGPLVFSPMVRGAAIGKALAMSPAEVIRALKTARLRGRGGAGFPTGLKWEFARAASGERRIVICNADEGEPGTFKDRVILTERADRILAGMTIAGYAIGADTGIMYLRAEYAYLRAYLEHLLAERRKDGLLGRSVLGKRGFDFDIRIQMGAGAYVCGEETSLISSCEGLRGDPKNRPPFPAQKGYMGHPTIVNNVETFCCVTKILELGPGTFNEHGTQGSAGTKVLSISGDCKRAGVYEVPFGIRLSEVLRMVGAEDAIAVQVGGPSGQMVGREQFDRTICYDDLATGGAIMVFGPGRDLLHVASRFMEFFCHESCGYCTPCRVGTRLLRDRLAQIRAGQGRPEDLEYLQDLGETMKLTSRCGLGQTAANPVLTTMKSFPRAYEALLRPVTDGRNPTFNLQAALVEAARVVGRGSSHA